MSRNVLGSWAKAAVVVAALAPSAWAFCGFYVAQEPGTLFNRSSKVVLVRDGNHTVLTMANDYRGDPQQFGLVVPVPQEIQPGMVKVAERAVLDKRPRGPARWRGTSRTARTGCGSNRSSTLPNTTSW